MNTTLRSTIGALIIAAAIPAAAIAQADRTPQPTPEVDQPAGDEREHIRERIERQLEMIEHRREALQGALAQLDAGAPLEDIRAAAAPEDRPDRRSDRRPGPPTDRNTDRPRRPRADTQPPNPKQIDHIMEFLERANPDVAHDLVALRENDPEAFHKKLAEIHPRVQSAMRRFDDRPERFRIMMEFRNTERRAHELARRIVQSDQADPETDLALELRQAVAEGFDIRQRLHESEIEEARAHLDELESREEEWTTSRQQMIDRHIAELIDHAASGDPFPSRRERFQQLQQDRQKRRPRERGTPRHDRPEAQ